MHTQFSNLSFLSNWRTRVIYFLLLPVANLLLLILISGEYENVAAWRVALGSIVIEGATLSLQSMSQLLVTDARLKIDIELISKKPYSIRYWGNKFLAAIVPGIILASVNTTLLFLVKAPLHLVFRAYLLIVPICVVGAILGFTSWCVSWEMKNPYFFTNLISSLLVLVSGALILVSEYPMWLQVVSKMFPLYSFINWLSFSNGSVVETIINTSIWLIIGVVLYVVQIPRVLRNKTHEY
ncbi:ABC transporter permease [Furfurilactobacillus entadae]|uniref:antibiotic transporter permease n=1 Tax=Furfurilactobacillus entadae TaxID=2922307 RepID=UPI0035EF263E